MPEWSTLLFGGCVIIAMIVALWLESGRPELMYPELARYTDKTDGRRALRRARRNVGGLVLATGLGVMIIGLVVEVIPQGVVRIFVACGLGTGFALSLTLLFRRKMRQFLRRDLLSLGLPICLGCGYDLTGNVTGVCPECGNQI